MILRFKVEAESDLIRLFDYIAAHAGHARAAVYIERIVATCESLLDLPSRGSPRPDLGRELRLIALDRHTSIVYRGETDHVLVVGVFYRGRDLPNHLSARADE